MWKETKILPGWALGGPDRLSSRGPRLPLRNRPASPYPIAPEWQQCQTHCCLSVWSLLRKKSRPGVSCRKPATVSLPPRIGIRPPAVSPWDVLLGPLETPRASAQSPDLPAAGRVHAMTCHARLPQTFHLHIRDMVPDTNSRPALRRQLSPAGPILRSLRAIG